MQKFDFSEIGVSPMPESIMTSYPMKSVSARTIYGRICSIMENNRPFVRAPQYFGPDRRRRHREFTGQDQRHRGASDVAEKEPATPKTAETSSPDLGLDGWLKDAMSAVSGTV